MQTNSPNSSTIKIPLIYLLIHYKLQEKNIRIITKDNLCVHIKYMIKFPKNKRHENQIIREMECFNLVKKINNKAGYMINQDRFIINDILE